MHDLGTGLNKCLAKDRSVVDFRRLTVSSTRVAGRTIAEVDMPGRFQGVNHPRQARGPGPAGP